jgi:hypothetical protein
VSQQADIFKVRLGFVEIKRRDRDTQRKRDIETEMTIKIPSKAGQPN